MQQQITFRSDGLTLSGIVHLPANLGPAERGPGFLVLHGFGGNKSGRGQTVMAEQLTEWGYVALRFDFRGCGESEGEHGRIPAVGGTASASFAASIQPPRPGAASQACWKKAEGIENELESRSWCRASISFRFPSGCAAT